MDDIVVTLKYQTKTWDLALPTAVPFQQLAHILAEKLDGLEDFKGLAEHSSVSGLVNGNLIIRPHETLEIAKVTDGAFLELITTPKSIRDGIERGTGGGPHLRSVDTDEVFQCRGHSIRIGRIPGNTIVLSKLPHSDVVSREHATIFNRNGIYWIQDNGSSNGTLVDGVIIRGRDSIQLRSGSHIQFGKDGPILVLFASQRTQ